MRRFLLATAALLTVAVSTSSAGYIIIRVLLEGSGGPAGGGAGAPGGRPGMGFGGFGSGGSAGGGGIQPPGGYGSGGTAGGGGMQPPGGLGQPGGAAATPVGPSDPTRSVVVVIPFTKRPVEKAFYPKTAAHPQTNPKWDFVMGTPFGATNLFTDGNTIQWYFGDHDRLATMKPRSVQVAEKYTAWQKSRSEDALLELVTEALEQGFVPEAVKYADELLALTKAGKKSPSGPVQRFTQAYGMLQAKLTAPAAKPNDAQRWRDVIDSVDARVQTNKHYSLVYWDASNDEIARRFALLDDNFKAFYLWHALQGVAPDVPEKPLMAVLPRRANDLYKLSQALDGLPIEADAFYSAEHDLLVLSPERTDSAGQTFLRQNQAIYKDGLSRAKLLSGDGPKIDGQHTPDNIARMMTLALVEKYTEMESELAGISREGCRQLMYASGTLPRHVVLPRWVSNGSANFFARPKGPVYSLKRVGGFTTDEAATPPQPGATPPPPAYSMTIALTTGYGGPNFVLQRYFKDMDAAKELNADRAQLLRNVVTDAYFHAASKDGEDVDPQPKQAVAIPIPSGGFAPPGGGFGGAPGAGGMQPPGGLQPPGGPRGGGGGIQPPGGSGLMQPPGSGFGGGVGGMAAAAPAEDLIAIRRKKIDKLAVKSQATSWALYYYLVKRHPASLARFIDEMARLPRDLPIDDQTTLAAFARAFNLTTAAAGESGKATFAEFAADWMKYMTELPPAGIDIDKLLDVTGAPAAPGAGAGRGGFPGGGIGSPDGGG